MRPVSLSLLKAAKVNAEIIRLAAKNLHIFFSAGMIFLYGKGSLLSLCLLCGLSRVFKHELIHQMHLQCEAMTLLEVENNIAARLLAD